MQKTDWKTAYEESLQREESKPLEDISCRNIIDGMRQSEEKLLQASLPMEAQWTLLLEMMTDVCCVQLPKWIRTNAAYAEAYAKESVEAVYVFRHINLELTELCLYCMERLSLQREKEFYADSAVIPVQEIQHTVDALVKSMSRKFKVKTGRRYNVLLRVFENTYEKMPPTEEMTKKSRLLQERMAELAQGAGTQKL